MPSRRAGSDLDYETASAREVLNAEKANASRITATEMRETAGEATASEFDDQHAFQRVIHGGSR